MDHLRVVPSPSSFRVNYANDFKCVYYFLRNYSYLRKEDLLIDISNLK